MQETREIENTITWKRRADGFLTRHFSGDTMDYRQIISIILPLLLDQAFLVCMNLLNTSMISSSGVAAVSAVNMVDSLNIFLVNCFIAVATGGTIVVAQYKGRQDDKMVPKAASASISTVFLLAASISALLVIFHDPLLKILFGGSDPDVFSNARTYLIGSSLSYCGIAIMEAVCGALRGIGETRSSLALTITMNLLYVVLNTIFINGFHMGVLGMAVAINAARYTAAILALLYLAKRNTSLGFRFRSLFAPELVMRKRILSIGLPFAAEQMFFNGGKILTQTFIVSLGTYALATNAICSSMDSLLQIPAGALCLAIVTVVGQCMGKGDIKQAKKVIRSFIILSSGCFVVMTLIVMPLFNPIVSLFAPPKEIVPEIFKVLLITAIAQIPIWSTSFMAPAALRAGGDSKYTSIMSMLSMWLFRVVLGYVLGITLGLGILGVWLAMDLEWGVRSLLFMTRLKGKKWYMHKVID